MNVKEITVSAGRTFNHPFESYSNLKPHVTVRAEIADGEDWAEAIKILQAKAEGLVEDHKQSMLKSLEELQDLTEKQARIANLSQVIARAQQELDSLRNGLPAIEFQDSEVIPF